jgi:hypothetical protein
MSKVVRLVTREEQEFAYVWNMASEEQRLCALATYIYKYNDKEVVNKICNKKLNDIEYNNLKEC